MKKNLFAFFAFAAFPICLIAQDVKPDKNEEIEKIEKAEKAEKKEKKETKEIIIRQNGDKDIQLKVEINGDNITVNGKPLAEFKDDNITINKRKMIIRDDNGDHEMFFNFSPRPDGEFQPNINLDGNFDFNRDWGRGDVVHSGAFLGVTTEETDNGAKVINVVKGSAAEKAGLKKDDIITKIGNEKINGPEELSNVIGAKKPKEEINISYKRAGKQSTTKATLGESRQARKMTYTFKGPGNDMKVFAMPRGEQFQDLEGLKQNMQLMEQDAMMNVFPHQKRIGLKLQDTEEGNGVKVINVEDSSAAALSGLKKDDIITTINDKKIENTDDAREEMAPDPEKRSYKISAIRNGQTMSFEIKIPRNLKTANF